MPNYVERKWILIDPVIVVCYSRNVNLTLGGASL